MTVYLLLLNNERIKKSFPHKSTKLFFLNFEDSSNLSVEDKQPLRICSYKFFVLKRKQSQLHTAFIHQTQNIFSEQGCAFHNSSVSCFWQLRGRKFSWPWCRQQKYNTAFALLQINLFAKVWQDFYFKFCLTASKNPKATKELVTTHITSTKKANQTNKKQFIFPHMNEILYQICIGFVPAEIFFGYWLYKSWLVLCPN